MRGEIPEITSFIKAINKAGSPVAAICAATLSLAHAGLLDDHRHTSNWYDFIPKYVPQYKGHKLYEKVRAVRDRNVITQMVLPRSHLHPRFFTLWRRNTQLI